MRAGSKDKIGHSLALLAKTSLIVFAGVALSKILSYVYRVLIARSFDPEIYGVYNLAVIIVLLFVTFAGAGLSQGILRYIAFYRGNNEMEKARFLFRHSLILTLPLSIIFGLLLFLSAPYISEHIFQNNNLTNFLKIFSIVIPLSSISSILLSSLRAFEKIRTYSFIFNISQNALRVVFLIVFILLGIESYGIAASYTLSIASMAILAYFFLRYQVPELFEKPQLSENDKKSTSKSVFSYSLPLLFFNILSMVFYWIDSLSIGYYKSAYEVGIYNAAVPIALLLSIVPDLFMQLFFPLITRAYAEKDTNLIKEVSKQISKWIFIINLPIFLILILFPGLLLGILFGSEYLSAALPLRILLIGSFVTSIFIVSDNLLSIAGRSKLILFNISISSLVNIVLNAILIPLPNIMGLANSDGLVGAAFATLVSIVLLNILFVIQAKRSVSIIPLRRKMINVALSAIIPFILLVFLKSNFNLENNIIFLVISLLIYFAIYAILIYVTKSLDFHDFDILKRGNKKINIFSKRN